MPFKFYPINLWMIVAILLPNLLFLIFPPVNVPSQKTVSFSWRILLMCEKVGQMCVFVLPLFWEVKASEKTPFMLAGMLIFLLIYYVGWARHFVNGRDYGLLFNKLLFFPLPLAISPILFFIFAALLLDSWPLMIGALILAIGHIPESYRQLMLVTNNDDNLFRKED